MDINFDKLNTSNFLYDPKSITFIDDLERDIPELKSWNEDFDKLKYCQYLTLMYDKVSPVNKSYQSTNFMVRKYKCADAVRLVIKRKSSLEEAIVGKNDYINDITIKYILLFGSPEIMTLVAYQSMLDIITRRAISGEFEKNDHDTIEKITQRINEKTAKLLYTDGADEYSHFVKALYKELDKEKEMLHMENIHKNLMSGDIDSLLENPYGDWKPNKMKFIDDK